MSEQAAREFIEKLKTNSDMRGQMAATVRDAAGDGTIKFAAENGYSFTAQDLKKAYIDELAEQGHSQEDIDDMMSSTKGTDFVFGVEPHPYADSGLGEYRAPYFDKEAPYYDKEGESGTVGASKRPY